MKSKGKNIIWLVSYPKSGNTWVRLFLNSILSTTREEKDGFPSLSEIIISSNRRLIDQCLGIQSSNLTETEVRDLQPQIYREFASQLNQLRVIKVHDSFGITSKGIPIFPADVSLAAVYIVRNPLDIVVSYAFHSGIPMQTAINNLNNPDFKISVSKNALKQQINQHLGTWSDHVNGWTNQKHIPVVLISFEQIIENAHEVFRSLLTQLNISCSEEDFSKALNLCSFSNLTRLEAEWGFPEKPIKSVVFFRNGKSGDYLNYLSKEQVEIIMNTHSETMKNFGYIDIIT